MTDQLPVPRSKNHSPILRIVGLAVVGMAGQGKSDGYSAVLLFWEYIAPSTKVGKRVPIPLSFFAFMTECIIWSLSCCTKDTDLKTEQFLSRFTALAPDRRRFRDLQPIVGSRPAEQGLHMEAQGDTSVSSYSNRGFSICWSRAFKLNSSYSAMVAINNGT